MIGSGFFCDDGVKKLATDFSGGGESLSVEAQIKSLSGALTVHRGFDFAPKRRRGDRPSGGGSSFDSPLGHPDGSGEGKRCDGGSESGCGWNAGRVAM